MNVFADARSIAQKSDSSAAQRFRFMLRRTTNELTTSLRISLDRGRAEFEDISGIKSHAGAD
jgi:hypothetical protein